MENMGSVDHRLDVSRELYVTNEGSNNDAAIDINTRPYINHKGLFSRVYY